MEDANRLLRLEREVEKALHQVQKPEELKELRLKYLGRKSELVLFLKNLKSLETEKVAHFGIFAAKVRNRIDLLLQEKESEL